MTSNAQKIPCFICGDPLTVRMARQIPHTHSLREETACDIFPGIPGYPGDRIPFTAHNDYNQYSELGAVSWLEPWSMAGGLGFEPRQTAPEAVVLPLHHPPMDGSPCEPCGEPYCNAGGRHDANSYRWPLKTEPRCRLSR